jgi:cytochrome c-type biogenesis protein CcmH/NrfG
MKGFPIIVMSALVLALAGCASSPFRKQPDAVSDVSPQALMALQESAAVAYAQGNAPAATGLYTQLLQSAPNDVHAWHRLGNLELLDDHYAQALIAYEHVLQLGGGNAGVWHNVAVIRLRQAQAALNQVQAQAPSPADALLRANSARAAQALPRVLGLLSPPPSSSVSGEQP